MKLGQLRAAVRDNKGVVLARAQLNGVTCDIPVQKTAFLKMLDVFGEHEGVETGLTFTQDGIVTAEGGEPATVATPAPAAPVTAEPLDLLGEPEQPKAPAPIGALDLLAGL